jgi:hypothetical protein
MRCRRNTGALTRTRLSNGSLLENATDSGAPIYSKVSQMLDIFDSNGNLDISLFDQAEMDALPPDELIRLQSLISAARTVADVETSNKAIESSINEMSSKRQALHKLAPPRASASDRATANAKHELEMAAQRRGQS